MGPSATRISLHSEKQPTCWRCQKRNLTQLAAVLKAEEYCHKIPIPFQFGEMGAYFCHYAQAWHIGHKGKSAAIEEAKYRMWGACDSGEFSHIPDMTVRTVRQFVEEVEDPFMKLTADDVPELQEGAVVGDIIETDQMEYNPDRIAAQAVKQVVMQRLREAKPDSVFEEFIDKEGEVITATVQRVESRWVTIDLGEVEAVMPPAEQSPFERYSPGQQLKFFVVQVGRTTRGPKIVVSRTHPDLLRRLFEIEVPEILRGVIEIKAIAREPGARSKVAVTSNQESVDAVGACVGLRGIRIQNVVNELRGEKIDVIEWDEDPLKFIYNSLSPAMVDRVDLDLEEKHATVVVPDLQMSLAIGRAGQNARLTAKLTNWRIDIQGTSQVIETEHKSLDASLLATSNGERKNE